MRGCQAAERESERRAKFIMALVNVWFTLRRTETVITVNRAQNIFDGVRKI